MSDQDPTKPTPNDEKFKPQNVQGKGKPKGRAVTRAEAPPLDTSVTVMLLGLYSLFALSLIFPDRISLLLAVG